MSPSPAHWSKDFVEHLRTVHFTLIGVATGLILIVLSAKPYNPVVALRQVHQILQLKNLWSPDWIREEGKTTPNHQDTNKYGDAHQNAKTDLLPVEDTVDLPIAGKTTVFYGEVIWRGHSRRPTVFQFSIPATWLREEPDIEWSPEEFPRTLSGFRHWWELLDHGYRINLPTMISVSDAVVSDPANRKVGRILSFDVSKATRGTLATLEKIELRPTIDRTHQMLVYAGYSSDNSIVTFPIGELLYVEVTQQTLCKYFGNWKTGAFDTAFLDLAQAAHDLEALQFDDTEKIISEEAAKGSEVFEAFGMKFPAGQITLWGIVILVGVQLYFFLYLLSIE